MCITLHFLFSPKASQREASDSVIYFSALSNLADVQNVTCLGLCASDIFPKSFA